MECPFAWLLMVSMLAAGATMMCWLFVGYRFDM
ncbi:hypothetical protein M233_10365 [Xylella fastidiosa subsp. multiplex Griffin-1]|nr:hypothetical protein P303_00990 [Xylella fastidiosa MUL0034]ERI59292.1 hypothetical protein M233_10365 [Xylella fastidiosa subsp. multiplex Griffin-1]KAF0571898.1 hypothetical protein P305_08745 [Xylella fastidiosa subsp. fastidiosa Mus-1]